jgi:hypothetical protein
MNKYLKIIIGIIIIGAIFQCSILIPLFINFLYYLGNKFQIGPNTIYSANDLLQFFGAYLTFFGTLVLGALSLLQNQRLHNINRKLEISRYIVENEPHLLHSNSQPAVKWKMHQTTHITESGVNDVILLDENFIINNTRYCMLYGEIILFTLQNYSLEYKVKDLKLSFSDSNLYQSEFVFHTNDDFKIATPVSQKVKEFKLILSMYFLQSTFIPENNVNKKQYKEAFTRLLQNSFSLTITMDIEIKSNNIVSPYFLYIDIKENDIVQDDAYFIPQHKMILNNAIKNGSSISEN